MYRELDLLNTVSAATAPMTAFSRTVTVPGDLIVVQEVNVVTPVGQAATGLLAARNPLQRVSLSFLNYIWPQGQVSDGGVPKFYAMQDETHIIVAPSPAAAYTTEFVGTVRPAVLSESNTQTVLTLYCPDAFLQCTMIFLSEWQKNTEAMAMYEANYAKLRESLVVELARQKSQAPQWQPYSPTQAATPPRM